jgi:hypothetical protein|tara:strand:- start:105 stop:455 length:351 start_codon:yes stop_codon:yes gene_type:complete
MDIGVCMSAEIFADKLQARDEDNTEQAWNLTRWPRGFTEEGEHHLFAAVDGAWQGYFTLNPEALFNLDDESAPFTLLFDTCTWTAIPTVPVKRFRGFTYNVPKVKPDSTAPPQDAR